MYETNEYYTIREQDPDCEEQNVVIPETIGQLVWKSSDGTHEVWEGDIIECRLFGVCPSICMAVWDINSLSFRLRWSGLVQYSPYSFVGFLSSLFTEKVGVVIGNIHDNPHLFNEYYKNPEQPSKE